MIKGPEPRAGASLAATRRTLSEYLRARLDEIEEAIFARIRAVADPERAFDPEYLAGMRAAVTEAVEYAIAGIEKGVSPNEPVPTAAVAQARRSARAKIPLDTVLRRYAAGDRLLAEFIREGADEVPREAMRETLRAQGARADHIMAAIASEYEREIERIRRSPNERLGERVRQLLAGEANGDLGVAYTLDAWHVGLIAIGTGAEAAIARLAARLEAEALVVAADDEGCTIWAWLGRRQQPATPDLVAAWAGDGVSLALGEPRRGIEGWRLSHREAQAARQVMLLGAEPLVCARDVLVVAAVLQDDALAAALVATYLEPLRGRGDMEAVLRETIRAYFNAGQNAATAAAVLQVNRHTVERRIRGIEDKLGQQINACRGPLEVALAIGELQNRGSRRTNQEG